MSHSTLSLKQKSPSQVQMANLLASYDNTCKIGPLPQQLKVHLKKEAVINTKTIYVILYIEAGAETITVAIENQALLTWVNTQFAVITFHSLPEDIVITVLQKTLSMFWSWLENAFSQSIGLRGYLLTTGEHLSWSCDHHLSLLLSKILSVNLPQTEECNNTSNEYLSLECLLVRVAYPLKEKLIHTFPPRRLSEKISSTITWPLPLSIGFSRVRLAQIKNLQRGDIIFLQQSPGDERLFAQLTPSLLLLCKSESDKTLLIEKTGQPMNNDIDTSDDALINSLMDDNDTFNSLLHENTPTDEPEDAAIEKTLETDEDDTTPQTCNTSSIENLPSTQETEKKETLNTDTLPLTISFDVGCASITLDRLASLQPGYCFELPQGLNEYITLRVYNQTIAKGELIKIGDRLGVEITQLEPQ